MRNDVTVPTALDKPPNGPWVFKSVTGTLHVPPIGGTYDVQEIRDVNGTTYNEQHLFLTQLRLAAHLPAFGGRVLVG
jgi:hypothetical protein